MRSIHERLYFRPLLEAFAAGDAELLGRPRRPSRPGSAAFGFSDAERTRAAVRELTRGLTRSSRLMQQLLPLLLDWLSESPDPDLGLLGLRNLASEPRRADELTRTFRESPESGPAACASCSAPAAPGAEIAAAQPRPGRPAARRRAAADAAQRPSWSSGPGGAIVVAGRASTTASGRCERWKDRHLLGVAARDVLGEAAVAKVGADLTALAEASLEVALASARARRCRSR